ncbi:DEAD/DEAH box helicase family protein [Streptomyces sp. M10(2022)]
MTTTVHDVLKLIRETSKDNHELGTRFERLMVQFLRTDPQWNEQFSQVWLWADWPGAAANKKDTGIDLVAQYRDTGGFCAIQCKFYEPAHTVQKPDIDSFLATSGKGGFERRIIISTTEKWGPNAEDTMAGQQPPVTRIGMSDIDASPMEWHLPPQSGVHFEVDLTLHRRKSPRPYQREAIDDVFEGFTAHQRGKLIMACGTGKTFTGLKIVERLQQERAKRGEGEHTNVLFLVPSIALLSQTLREWSYETETPMRRFAVCSDIKVGKQKKADADSTDMPTHDLALPATTSPAKLIEQVASVEAGPGLTVVFSTYQSIETIAQAQQAGLPDFDLILCDEAHRTTGATLTAGDESNFVKVHDNGYIRSARRLYMTATPRLFSEDAKTDAKNTETVLCSMDDEDLYGPEFHRLGFGKAVEQGLLTDYKVLILTIDEGKVAESLQQQLADDNNELNLDDAAKIVGCWNGMAKRTGKLADGSGFEPGEAPMQRAVAFARNISESKELAKRFREVVQAYDGADEEILQCDVDHVDGTFNALRRNDLLDWLKQDPGPNKARILSNARCLSEGVDVPSLDAVLFLHPATPSSTSSSPLAVSCGWPRARSTATSFSPSPSPRDAAGAGTGRQPAIPHCLAGPPGPARPRRPLQRHRQPARPEQPPPRQHHGRQRHGRSRVHLWRRGRRRRAGEASAAQYVQTALHMEDWRDAIYAQIVKKVGQRQYWEDWAKDIAQIAERHKTRIQAALALPDKQAAFDTFLGELRASINPGVTETDALDMLTQHIVTKPVFDALFKGYAFAERNPVSMAMQRMLDVLDDQSLDAEAKTLQGFYDSVRKRAEGIDNHEGRQRVIIELYDKFFKTALPKTADALGIVYTPSRSSTSSSAQPTKPSPNTSAPPCPTKASTSSTPSPAPAHSWSASSSPASSSPTTSCASTPANSTPTRSCCSPTTSRRSTSRPPSRTWAERRRTPHSRASS